MYSSTQVLTTSDPAGIIYSPHSSSGLHQSEPKMVEGSTHYARLIPSNQLKNMVGLVSITGEGLLIGEAPF